MKGYDLILPPTVIVNESCQVDPVQISIHNIIAKTFMSEIRTVFPNIDWTKGEVVIVSTMQHALMDLVQVGDDVEKEKERLLENVCLHSQHCVCFFSFTCAFAVCTSCNFYMQKYHSTRILR